MRKRCSDCGSELIFAAELSDRLCNQCRDADKGDGPLDLMLALGESLAKQKAARPSPTPERAPTMGKTTGPYRVWHICVDLNEGGHDAATAVDEAISQLERDVPGCYLRGTNTTDCWPIVTARSARPTRDTGEPK